ncbi:hypothetical protein OQA88_5753 [Cercophora sp. LCS_1]
MSSPGYTDEVAEECHDLIDRAEEEAHLHDEDNVMSGPPHGKMYKKAGLESKSSEGGGMASNMKETMGKKMDQMKDTMGMKK